MVMVMVRKITRMTAMMTTMMTILVMLMMPMLLMGMRKLVRENGQRKSLNGANRSPSRFVILM